MPGGCAEDARLSVTEKSQCCKSVGCLMACEMLERSRSENVPTAARIILLHYTFMQLESSGFATAVRLGHGKLKVIHQFNLFFLITFRSHIQG